MKDASLEESMGLFAGTSLFMDALKDLQRSKAVTEYIYQLCYLYAPRLECRDLLKFSDGPWDIEYLNCKYWLRRDYALK